MAFNMMNGYGLGSIATGIGNLFNKNPSDASGNYLNQIPGAIQGAYQPWMDKGINALDPYTQGGQWAGGQYQNQIGSLLNNPTGMFNQWGSTYQQSPGYQWQVGQATNAANNAAAAGGMAGSPMEQQQLAGTVNQLANQDYWSYINNAQNLYGLGFQGLSNMYGVGANAAGQQYGAGAQMAGQYGQELGQNLTNQAQNAYLGQQYQNQNRGGIIGDIAGGLSFLGL